MFWGLLAEAAKSLLDYDIEIIEAHHNQKKDAPSGTAVKAAEVISKTLGGKEFVYGRHGLSPRKQEIGIHAVRGDFVGDHTVLFAGDGERIEIKHQAHSRQAFAKGAVRAAIWICSAKPGLYEMADVLGIHKVLWSLRLIGLVWKFSVEPNNWFTTNELADKIKVAWETADKNLQSLHKRGYLVKGKKKERIYWRLY